MKAEFFQDGKVIDLAVTDAVAAGDIVIAGNLVGVAKTDIPANTVGCIATEGVYKVEKAEGVSFTLGADVYWKAETGLAQGSGDGCVKIGIAVAAAANADATVKVKIG